MKAIFNHERYKLIGGVLCIALVIWAYGCESKTPSLITTGKKVNRAELQLELDTLIASSGIRVQDLNRQDRFKTALFEQSMLLAQGGTLNPVGLGFTVAGILGIGAATDDIRTRKRTKKQLSSD